MTTDDNLTKATRVVEKANSYFWYSNQNKETKYIFEIIAKNKVDLMTTFNAINSWFDSKEDSSKITLKNNILNIETRYTQQPNLISFVKELLDNFVSIANGR